MVRGAGRWCAGVLVAVAGCADADAPGDGLERLAATECVVVNPGPGPGDGLVGICHLRRDEHDDDPTVPYDFPRLTPAALRPGGG